MIESKVSRRLSSGGIVVTTTVGGAGGRDVSDLTTVVALLSAKSNLPPRRAYSSASLLRALSGDVSFLTTVLVVSFTLIKKLRITHVALLGSTESSGTAESSLSTTTTTGWAVSGDVADTTAGLIISL